MCCDHGELALHLARELSNSHIKALDIIPKITTNLNVKLKQRYPQIEQNLYKINESKLEVVCLDAKQAITNELDLAIICGIGSDLMIDILESLKTKPQLLLLCSHKNPLKLRNYLNQSLWGLEAEQLIYDRGQYYECYFMNTHNHEKISLVGSRQFWSSGEMAHHYLNKRTYELMLKKNELGICSELEQLIEIKKAIF